MISIYFNKTSEDHWCLKPGQVLKTSGFTLQFASEALRCNREAGIMLISLFCVSIDDEDNTRMMRMMMRRMRMRMRRMRMKMKMRMMTLYQLEISSPGGDRTWACRKVSGFPLVLLPAYSLLKQEQLQLAQPAFVAFPKMFKGHFFFNVCSLETCCANTISLKENGKTVQLGNYHDVLRESGGGTARKKSA